MSTVDSSAVPMVAYREHSATSLPRIARLIAILAIVYGLSNLAHAAIYAFSLWTLQASAFSARFWSYAISWSVDLVIGTLLVCGAASLLRKGSHDLIGKAFWIQLIIWPVGTVLTIVLLPGAPDLSLLSSTTLDGMERNLFPVLALLLLRAYRLR
jgi:hypothetical protein